MSGPSPGESAVGGGLKRTPRARGVRSQARKDARSRAATSTKSPVDGRSGRLDARGGIPRAGPKTPGGPRRAPFKETYPKRKRSHDRGEARGLPPPRRACPTRDQNVWRKGCQAGRSGRGRDQADAFDNTNIPQFARMAATPETYPGAGETPAPRGLPAKDVLDATACGFEPRRLRHFHQPTKGENRNDNRLRGVSGWPREGADRV